MKISKFTSSLTSAYKTIFGCTLSFCINAVLFACIFASSCGDTTQSHHTDSSLHTINDNKEIGLFLESTIKNGKLEKKFVLCRKAKEAKVIDWQRCHSVFFDHLKRPIILSKTPQFENDSQARNTLAEGLSAYESHRYEDFKEQLVASLPGSVRNRNTALLASMIGVTAYAVRKAGIWNMSSYFNVSSQDFIAQFVNHPKLKGFQARGSIIRYAGMAAIGTGIALVFFDKLHHQKLLKNISKSQENLFRLNLKKLHSEEETLVKFSPEIFSDVTNETKAVKVDNVPKLLEPLAQFLVGQDIVKDIRYYCLQNPRRIGGFAGNCKSISHIK